jgi:hypothetical protein
VDTTHIAILGLILTFVALVVPFIIYLLEAKNKRLSVKVLNETRLLTTSEVKEGKINVTYNGVEVNDIIIVNLLFMSLGRSPIVTSDFETPIEIRFGCPILSAKITRVVPNNLNVDYRMEKSSIFISPLLLNANDRFAIKILLPQLKYDLSISARIKDVKNIILLSSSDRLNNIMYKIGIIITFVSGFLSIFNFLLTAVRTRASFRFELYSLTSLFIGLSLVLSWYHLKWIKKPTVDFYTISDE